MGKTLEMRWREWQAADAAAWEAAAQELEAAGFERRDNSAYEATFHKGDEIMVLTRPLGGHDWQPRVK